MSAFMSVTGKTIPDEEFHVQVTSDFNDLFKDKNRLKVVIWVGSSYLTMGAESWFELSNKVACEWVKVRREAGHPMLANDPCIPASID